jgi:hypothetical protein
MGRNIRCNFRIIQEQNMNKYIKPNSLTWWASVSPLICGVFMASEPLHGMTGVVDSLSNATGSTAPFLINAGLAGIGIRGAMA